MNKKILIMGGSPCSGKSTIAEMIAREYGAHYFKVDDFLGEFMARAAAEGKETCQRYQGLSPDEIWLEDPAAQCRDEFLIYEEIAPYFFEKLEQIDEEIIVTEGAGYTPEVMKKHAWTYTSEAAPEIRYVAVIPTPEFQIEHYRQREWIQYVLAGCSDKERAFDNWMQRDILFGRQVKEECDAMGVFCFVNDGSETIEELYDQVKRALKLE